MVKPRKAAIFLRGDVPIKEVQYGFGVFFLAKFKNPKIKICKSMVYLNVFLFVLLNCYGGKNSTTAAGDVS